MHVFYGRASSMAGALTEFKCFVLHNSKTKSKNNIRELQVVILIRDTDLIPSCRKVEQISG